jgi:amino acid adenylation domain-containing protein
VRRRPIRRRTLDSCTRTCRRGGGAATSRRNAVPVLGADRPRYRHLRGVAVSGGGSGVTEATPEVRAALAARLRRAREREARRGTAAGGAIPRRPAEEPAPLSRAQERLWLQERLAPGSPLYNVARAIDLRGPVDAAALAAALAGVTRRHGALRHRFFDTGDGPRQQETAARPRLAKVDLDALPPGRRDDAARRIAAAEARRPFRLDVPPLLRARLLRLGVAGDRGEERSRLLLTVHHLVFDGWSLGLLLRDLSALYSRGLRRAGPATAAHELPPKGSPPAAGEPPLRFADYAAWERRPGRDVETEEERYLAWWRRRLAGAGDLPEPPFDRPRSASPSLAAGTRSFAVPAAAVAAADRLAAAAAQRGAVGATRFAVLLAAWAAVLARWSGGDELLVGTPLANRRPEVEELVGFFVNTVSLRLGLAGDPSGEELLRRVGESVVEAIEHGAVPFARVVQEAVERRTGGRPAHAPLHGVSFALANTPRGEVELPGVTVEGIEVVPRGVSDQDLTLALEEAADGGLAATLLYARGLFDATTAARLGDAWLRVLTALTAYPGAPLSELPLLSPAQSHQVRVEWPYTPRVRPARSATGESRGPMSGGDRKAAARGRLGTSEAAAGIETEAGGEVTEAARAAEGDGGVLRGASKVRNEAWTGGAGWDGGVLARVAAHAARRPAAPAVVAGDVVISYDELLRRADRLASELERRLAPKERDPAGTPFADSEPLVALCLSRSPELVVAALAVLRAGAAYLPVDIGLPAARVAWLLDDSAAPLVLARGELAAELAAAGRPVLDLDALKLDGADGAGAGSSAAAPGRAGDPAGAETVQARSDGGTAGGGGSPDAKQAASAAFAPPHPDALAYVIYTSGSTGRPKGTLLAHRGLANLAAWHRDAFGLGPGDRATLLAGTGFDASVWELWSALAAGAALHLPPAEVAASPAPLAAWLAEQRIGHCFLPTPLAEAVLAEPAAAALAGSLRVLLVGGDRLHRWAGGVPFRLVNDYGPTESTVVATSGDVAAAPPRSSADALPPIGRPLPGVPCWVLDRRLEPLPPGTPGELCIGGVGLARGYLGRPGLTAERLVPHPFEPGGRLYRSGDLVRWRGDGQLDFLGRIDQQVKVRGHRIELGEIEAALAALPAVREAAVAAPAAGGERRLVACVVPAAPEAGDRAAFTGALAAELRRRLPESMVPAAWLVLEALPLTANGKVDRRALEALAPDGLDAAGPAGEEPPRTPLEELVAGQFLGVLRTGEGGDEERAGAAPPPALGRDADFFRLGGHSLLAARLVTRLRDALGVEVPLRRVFAAPTVAGVAALVEEARAGSAAGEPADDPAAAEPPLVPVPRGGDLPASSAQRRLWFLDRLDPGAPTYNMPAAVDLDGDLDRAALAAALAALAARHEALHTTLPAVDGEPVQRIAPAAAGFPPLPVVDLAALPPPRRDAEARRLGREEGRRPFDLAAGPLLRVRLLALGAAAPGHRLLLTVHHAVFDGASTAVVLRELVALYAAARGGGDAALPALPLGYADFAAWEPRRLAGGVLERHLAWWRGELTGVPVLELPTDRPRPAVPRERGRRLRVDLPPDLAAAVRTAARSHGATPFMVLLAAFAALLSRHAGQEDFAVGTPVAGRPRRELDGVVGFFVDTLALRCDLAAVRGFGELVAQVRSRLLASYEHQEVPFDRLVEELAPGRDLAHTPLFQVMFVLQNAFAGGDLERSGGGVAFRLAPVETTTSKFEVTLSLGETADGGFAGWWVYRSDLFDATTARRMAGRFAVLLRGALETPRRPLADLPLLAAGERHQVLVEWNAPRVEYADPPGSGGLLPTLFAAAAARHPEAPALVWEAADGGRASLSYAELAARAARLARRLRALGVGPEVRVGLCAERSPRTVVGVLGVLLAGGAYVPLDPALPAERLSFMLRDAGLAAVLVTAATEAVLRDAGRDAPAGTGTSGAEVALRGGGARLLRLDELDDPAPNGTGAPRTAAAAAALAALPPPPSEAAAYVLYTSGSTGTPKGVAVPHAALGNRLRFARAADLAPGDAFLHKTTLAFDVSVAELLAPLVAGARVVLARPGGEADPAYLAGLMARAGVTQASFPPALLEALLDEPAFAALPALRTVVTGGETVPAELPGRFHAVHPAADLLDRYGPTEATISVTSWTCRRGVAERTLPIGRPTAKARVHLLDRRGRPVPVGVPGEIRLGGVCVARGYLGRPARTAEAFVPDPLGGEPGARLYRSGDVARWRPDGALEFLGRVDRQVKVRGYRIELGEVEAALRRHPALEAAAVVDLPDGASRRLAAYLVAAHGAELDIEAVRSSVAEALPRYMLPADWVVVDALPLSATGKVDRKALPEPPRSAPSAARVAPRDGTETALAGIFATVLGVGTVGVHDGFFDLGGHSLLATRLVSRVRERFGADLPLRAVFEEPTVARLAARLRAGGAASRAGAGAVPPAAAGAAGAPLSFAQQRLWFLDRLQPGGGVYNLPAALRLRGPLRVGALRAALRRVVGRHEVLRSVFAAAPADAAEPVQLPLPASPAAAARVPLVDLAALPAGRRRHRARRELVRWGRHPFDLARGPLGRYLLLRLGRGEHLFGFAHHHAVFDGASVALFRRELAELYDAAAAGRRPRLPALPLQFADHAAAERRRAAAGEWDAAADFWRRELADLPVLELPLDRPRPARRGGGGAERRRRLPAAAVEALARLAHHAGASLFMAVLAVAEVLLARLCGQADFAVGTPVGGRGRAGTEHLLGLFVNTLALRSDLAAGAGGDGPSFAELLVRVRRRALAAYAHWELPFERLVEELAPQRDLARTPLFQVLLLLRDEAAPVQRLAGGVAAEALALPGAGAKVDLTLALAPWGERLDGGAAVRDAPVPDGGDWALLAEYDPALFDATTIDRLLDRLGRLLAAAAESPGTPVLALPWLSAAERHQLVAEWNDRGPFAGAAAATLHGAVLAGLEGRPEEEVVVIGQDGEAMTAGELTRRSGVLAARLRRLGVGPEVPVGVAVRREPVLVVALLAVLRAGGAYLPLDAGYPRERLALMLADAAAPVVLADAAGRQALPPGPWRVESPEGPEPGAEAAPLPGAPLSDTPVLPRNLAYLIYTSGSTGRPKGVAIPHAAAAALLAWARDSFSAAELSHVLGATSVCFDLSVFEIFTPLAAGGRLVLAADALGLATHPAAGRVSLLNTVPSAAAALLDAGALPPSLRTVNLAGEPLRRDLVERLRAAGGEGLRIRNLYGPSEDTTYSTAAEAGEETAREGREPSLGRPLPGTAAHVVDRRLSPCPAGVAGELMLSGAGLARGYLGRPALTAASWLPDPFASRPGGRLYRTGDLARRRADGRLEFLGRRDHQVKVRGFRVEPGEVEVALAAHPAVREAVVLAAGERLAAFALAADPAAAGDEALARGIVAAAAGRLPAYMLPASLELLAALPRTASGKVDRRALLDRAAAAPRERRPGTAPRSRAERLVAELWHELLGVKDPTVESDFFHLGGHSLLATRMVARLSRRAGVELPLRALFEARTLGELAARLEAARPASGGGGAAVEHDPLVLLGPPAGGPPLFLVHPVGGDVLCYRELVEAMVPAAAAADGRGPIYGLRARGLEDGQAPWSGIDEMAERYAAAVRAAHPAGAVRLGGWSLGGVVAFEMARRLGEAGVEVTGVVALDSHLPPPEAAPQRDVAHTRERRLRAFARHLGLPAAAVGGPPPTLERLAAAAREAGLLAPRSGAEVLERLFTVYEAHLEAFAAHRPRRWEGHVVLLAAADGPAGAGVDVDRWRRRAGSVEVHAVPGDHFTILRGDSARCVAEHLERVLWRSPVGRPH